MQWRWGQGLVFGADVSPPSATCMHAPCCMGVERMRVQEGAFVGAIGMQCEVGDCLYAAPPPPPAPAPEPPHWRLPRLNHPEEVTLVCLGLLVAAFLAGVGYFVRLDRARVVHLGSHGSAAQLHGGEAGSDSDDDQELASIPLTAACAPPVGSSTASFHSFARV